MKHHNSLKRHHHNPHKNSQVLIQSGAWEMQLLHFLPCTMVLDWHQDFTHWCKTQPYTQGLLQRALNNSYSDNQRLQLGQCDQSAKCWQLCPLCPAMVRLFKLPINCSGSWMQLHTEHTKLRFISSGAATTHLWSFSPRFCLEAEQRYFMFTTWAN